MAPHRKVTMGVTKAAMKKLAFAAMAGAGLLLVAAGLWMRSPWLTLSGVLAGLAVVGLLALLTLRRAGYLIVLARDSEATLRQELAEIGREQARIADEIHRAALADFRELMLSAYREIFDEVQALAASEARAAASLTRIEQAVTRIGAMADALDVQVAATRASLARIEEGVTRSGAMADALDVQVAATRASLAKRADALAASLETLGQKSSERFAGLRKQMESQAGGSLERLASLQEGIGLLQAAAKEAGDLAQEGKTAMAAVATTLDERVAKPVRRINQAIDNGDLRYPLLNDIGSILRLQQRFQPRTALPRMSGWTLDSSTLERLVEYVVERGPKLMVECGSGASTVWLAYAARAAGARLVSLEHLERYAAETAGELARHGLGDVAEVRLAPLEELEIEGTGYHWYGRRAWEDIEHIDMLLVDGPPKATGKHARFPAVPLLESRLADRCTIVFDDVHRKEEREILDRWRELNPAIGVPHPIGERTVLVEWAPRSTGAA